MYSVGDYLALDRISQQPSETLHSVRTHAITRHLLYADPQPRRVAGLRIAWQQVVVDDNIIRLQALRHRHTPSVGRHIDGNLMTRRIAKISGLHPDPIVIERPPQGLRIADNLGSIGGGMLAH